jgi:hypothetical protein
MVPVTAVLESAEYHGIVEMIVFDYAALLELET